MTKATKDVLDLAIREVQFIKVKAADGTSYMKGVKLGDVSPEDRSDAYVTNLFVKNVTIETGGFLDVSATGSPANVVGVLRAYYGDIAERYKGDRVYPVGTLVSLGGSEEITIVSTELSTEVFGVVSQHPAFVLNSESDEDIYLPIALIGRVPVRVIGPVSKGQRLVASDIPGVARGIDADDSVTRAGLPVYFAKSIVDDTATGERLVLAAFVTTR